MFQSWPQYWLQEFCGSAPHWTVVQTPLALHALPPEQVPHDPLQPSSPQFLPLQFGVQVPQQDL